MTTTTTLYTVRCARGDHMFGRFGIESFLKAIDTLNTYKPGSSWKKGDSITIEQESPNGPKVMFMIRYVGDIDKGEPHNVWEEQVNRIAEL